MCVCLCVCVCVCVRVRVRVRVCVCMHDKGIATNLPLLADRVLVLEDKVHLVRRAAPIRACHHLCVI